MLLNLDGIQDHAKQTIAQEKFKIERKKTKKGKLKN